MATMVTMATMATMRRIMVPMEIMITKIQIIMVTIINKCKDKDKDRDGAIM